MFYDERIEGVKGKIAQRAILLSLVISLVLGGVHLANIIRNAPYAVCFWLVSLEIAICAGALLALTIGFTVNKLHEKDERTEAAQSAFYNSAAKALIAFVLGVFAFATPVVLYIGRPYNFSDGSFGNILYVLFFIVGIYVIYGFRRNDIYFNYSIMDSDSYYKGVFKNVGKLGLGALALLGISAVSFVGIVAIKNPSAARVVKILLDTLAYYIGGFIEIALLYLLYSLKDAATIAKTPYPNPPFSPFASQSSSTPPMPQVRSLYMLRRSHRPRPYCLLPSCPHWILISNLHF